MKTIFLISCKHNSPSEQETGKLLPVLPSKGLYGLEKLLNDDNDDVNTEFKVENIKIPAN